MTKAYNKCWDLAYGLCRAAYLIRYTETSKRHNAARSLKIERRRSPIFNALQSLHFFTSSDLSSSLAAFT
ncbi:hypothetical protein ABKN59_008335 [Abortiporus biennis]